MTSNILTMNEQELVNISYLSYGIGNPKWLTVKGQGNSMY